MALKFKLTSLVCNTHGFRKLLKHHYFEVLGDHKATKNLGKSKKEPAKKETDSAIDEIM